MARKSNFIKLLYILKNNNSYIYDKFTKLEIKEWLKYKIKIYPLIGSLIIKICKESSFKGRYIDATHRDQFIIEVIHFIYLILLESRKTPFNIIYNINIYFYLFYKIIIDFFKSIIKSSFEYRYEFDPNNKYIIIYGFPSHAFNYSQKIETVNFSLAEYLVKKYGTNQGYNFLTINEFKRDYGNKLTSDSILNLYRQSPIKKINYFRLFYNFFESIFKLFLSFFNKNTYLSVYELILNNNSKSLENLLSNNDNIVTLYKLATNSLGAINYKNKFHYKIVNYVYSQNFCECPTKYLNKYPHEDIFEASDFSIDAFLAYGGAVGYTNIWSYLNTYRKNNGLAYTDSSLISKETDCLIGYQNLNLNNIQFKYILLFDIPPYSQESSIYNHIIGNKILSYNVLQSFIREIVIFAKQRNYKIVLKPKFNLNKYSAEYKKLLTTENIIVSDPYCKSDELIKNSEIVINIPYSTTKIVSEFYGKPSIFFLPGFLEFDFKDYNFENIVFGIKGLNNLEF